MPERAYEFPEVTGWIRAVKRDFRLVKDMGLKETGILTSCSDYHVFLKLRKSRSAVVAMYLDTVKSALDAGIRPRCHFEDVTRADLYGFVLPLAGELVKLGDEYDVKVKMRMCDTMGVGLPCFELPRIDIYSMDAAYLAMKLSGMYRAPLRSPIC